MYCREWCRMIHHSWRVGRIRLSCEDLNVWLIIRHRSPCSHIHGEMFNAPRSILLWRPYSCNAGRNFCNMLRLWRKRNGLATPELAHVKGVENLACLSFLWAKVADCDTAATDVAVAAADDANIWAYALHLIKAEIISSIALSNLLTVSAAGMAVSTELLAAHDAFSCF